LTADQRYSGHTPEEIENLSVEIPDSSRRNKKILRNFEIFLPKFHFILPNFYFPVPWGNFVFSLEISDFLGESLKLL